MSQKTDFWLNLSFSISLSARFMIDCTPKRISSWKEQGSVSHLTCAAKTGRVLPFRNQLSQIALASSFRFSPHTISKPVHKISLHILTIHVLYADRETRKAASDVPHPFSSSSNPPVSQLCFDKQIWHLSQHALQLFSPDSVLFKRLINNKQYSDLVIKSPAMVNCWG